MLASDKAEFGEQKRHGDSTGQSTDKTSDHKCALVNERGKTCD